MSTAATRERRRRSATRRRGSGGRTIRTRLVLSLACVICVALAASALITAIAVRDYLTDRQSGQLVAAATRMAPSLRALNGVTLDYQPAGRCPGSAGDDHRCRVGGSGGRLGPHR